MYKIGKIKIQRQTIVMPGESDNNKIISINGDLDTNLYDDITSIKSWIDYETLLCTDRLQCRERIREILDSIGWDSLTNDEKDLIIELHLNETNKSDNTTNTEKIVYLMGKGLGLTEAKMVLIKSYSSYHITEIDSCSKRANSEKLYEIIAKYLSLQDASDLVKIAHKLLDLYKTQGIRGVNSGNGGEGIFDFIESTVGTSYEASGLRQQGYVLSYGNYDTLISELMDVIKYGNY